MQVALHVQEVARVCVVLATAVGTEVEVRPEVRLKLIAHEENDGHVDERFQDFPIFVVFPDLHLPLEA